MTGQRRMSYWRISQGRALSVVIAWFFGFAATVTDSSHPSTMNAKSFTFASSALIPNTIG